jgi:DNA-binding winged helix-turn-helix (wHTH) protein
MPVQTKFVFRFADLEVHESELRATRAGRPLDIEPKAFRVLVHLVKHASHLVSKSELIDAVWGDTAVTENSLTRAIALLRRVLEDDPHQPHFIETVSTAGYRFICPVETEGAPEVPAESGGASINGTAPADTGTLPAFLSRWRWALAASAAGAALAAGGASLWYIHQPLPPPHIGEIKQLTRDVRFRYKAPLGFSGGRVYFRGMPRGLFAVSPAGDVEKIPVLVPWSSDQPVWPLDVSPDGEYFLAWPLGDPHLPIWVFTSAGKPVRYLADAKWGPVHFSPDGKPVIYVGEDGMAYAIPSAGGEPRSLFTPAGRDPGGFFSSPDGKRNRYSSAGQI